MMWVDLTDQPWAAETIARLRDVEPMARLSGIVGVTADGCIMGIDRESGGYPWKAYKPNGSIQSVGNIHFFKDDEDADRYLEMFPEYKKKKITITITEES